MTTATIQSKTQVTKAAKVGKKAQRAAQTPSKGQKRARPSDTSATGTAGKKSAAKKTTSVAGVGTKRQKTATQKTAQGTQKKALKKAPIQTVRDANGNFVSMSRADQQRIKKELPKSPMTSWTIHNNKNNLHLSFTERAEQNSIEWEQHKKQQSAEFKKCEAEAQKQKDAYNNMLQNMSPEQRFCYNLVQEHKKAKSARKKREERKHGKPKQPRGPYAYFVKKRSKEFEARVRKEHPHLDVDLKKLAETDKKKANEMRTAIFAETGKMMGVVWKTMTEKERGTYVRLAQKDAERQKTEMKAFRLKMKKVKATEKKERARQKVELAKAKEAARVARAQAAEQRKQEKEAAREARLLRLQTAKAKADQAVKKATAGAAGKAKAQKATTGTTSKSKKSTAGKSTAGKATKAKKQ